jgi:hypothetical protein
VTSRLGTGKTITFFYIVAAKVAGRIQRCSPICLYYASKKYKNNTQGKERKIQEKQLIVKWKAPLLIGPFLSHLFLSQLLSVTPLSLSGKRYYDDIMVLGFYPPGPGLIFPSFGFCFLLYFSLRLVNSGRKKTFAIFPETFPNKSSFLGIQVFPRKLF